MSAATQSDLEQVFDKVTEWRRRVESLPSAPQVGSSLAKDDSLTSPYQVSHAVMVALTGAVDQLDTVRCVINVARTVPTHAVFTMLRASIENASVAVWLLAPGCRNERVLRRLRLQWSDFVDGDSARALIDPSATCDLEAKKVKLQAIGRARSFDANRMSQIAARPIAYSSIVGIAGVESRVLTERLIKASWMLCSGMTHAKPWATLSLLDREELKSASEDVLNLKLTAPDSGIVMMTHIAAMIIQEAWWIYDLRSAPH